MNLYVATKLASDWATNVHATNWKTASSWEMSCRVFNDSTTQIITHYFYELSSGGTKAGDFEKFRVLLWHSLGEQGYTSWIYMGLAVVLSLFVLFVLYKFLKFTYKKLTEKSRKARENEKYERKLKVIHIAARHKTLSKQYNRMVDEGLQNTKTAIKLKSEIFENLREIEELRKND
jgi:hypothetical protein